MKKVSIILMLLSCMLCSDPSFGNGSFEKNKPTSISPVYNWSVSSYGFLIFPTGGDIDQFIALMESKTHAEAQAYLDSIGFSSLGATMYTKEYADQMVTGDQAINYTLNISRVIQVYGIVIKPVSESTSCEDIKWQFILAMSSSNLSTESYYSFSRGIYDGSVMNKYATNPPASDTLSLVTKMSQSSSGNEATDSNPCPTTSSERRPFWGYGQSSCTPGTSFNPVTNTWVTTYTYCQPSYYVFWVNVNPGNCWVLDSGPCPPVN